jgi:hypothetical protein
MFATIAHPAARNFSYDVTAETTIRALRVQAQARRSATLLLTLIGFACATLPRMPSEFYVSVGIGNRREPTAITLVIVRRDFKPHGVRDIDG